MAEDILKAEVRLLGARADDRRRKGQGRSRQVELSRFNYDEHLCVPPRIDLELLASMYDRNVPHKACCDAKTYNSVGIGYEIVPVNAAQQADPEVVERITSWLEGMARRDRKTFAELLVAARLDEETVGFGAIEISRNGKGEPDGLYHVPAHTLRRRQYKDGWVQKVEERYTYFLEYPLTVEDAVRMAEEYPGRDPQRVREAFTGSNQLIILGKPSPTSPFYPLPDHVPAMASILGDEYAEAYQLQFFEHNASPRWAILVHGGKLSADTKRYLVEYLKSAVKGPAHRTLLLESEGQGAQIELMPLNAHERQDSAFVGYRMSTMSAVIMAHRVSPSKVTIIENANLANSKDQDKTFKEQTLKPSQERWEARINWLLEEIGETKYRFRFKEMDLADEQQIAQTNSVYFGVMTVNEARQLRGLEPFSKEAGHSDALVEWGKKPVGTTFQDATGEGSGFPGFPGDLLADWKAPDDNMEDLQESEDTQTVEELSSEIGKGIPIQHLDFVAKARELGYVIDAIVENLPTRS